MRNIVHGALMLVLNLLAIAGLYLTLESSFLSIIQVLVYAGAIMVLFLFVIMLLGVDRDDLLVEPAPHQVLAVLGGRCWPARCCSPSSAPTPPTPRSAGRAPPSPRRRRAVRCVGLADGLGDDDGPGSPSSASGCSPATPTLRAVGAAAHGRHDRGGHPGAPRDLAPRTRTRTTCRSDAPRGWVVRRRGRCGRTWLPSVPDAGQRRDRGPEELPRSTNRPGRRPTTSGRAEPWPSGTTSRLRPAVQHRAGRRAAAPQRDRAVHVHRADAQRRQPDPGRGRPDVGRPDGQVFVFFVIVVAAAEVVVGLALIVNLFFRRGTLDVDVPQLLRY
jgi:multisubunit Na+/H+ antiporter MnhC subunit